MIPLFIAYACIISLVMSGLTVLIRNYCHGTYYGIWYIVTSCLYFCLIFIGAVYLTGTAL